MRTSGKLLLFFGVFAALQAGDVIDCIAISVGRAAVTRSAIEEQARITAFLNRVPVDDSPAARRRTAERLVDVVLIRREMEISRYAPAEPADVDKLLDRVRTEHGSKREVFQRELEKYKIDEAALRRHLALQAQTLRFVELRFRPGSSVTDSEVDLYYRDQFLPEFTRSNPNKTAPELEQIRERLEAEMLDQRVEQSMEQWLKEARAQTRVRYFEERCQ